MLLLLLVALCVYADRCEMHVHRCIICMYQFHSFSGNEDSEFQVLIPCRTKADCSWRSTPSSCLSTLTNRHFPFLSAVIRQQGQLYCKALKETIHTTQPVSMVVNLPTYLFYKENQHLFIIYIANITEYCFLATRAQ